MPLVAPAWRNPLGGKRTRSFDPGPPTTSPRRLNFYGHFSRRDAAKMLRLRRGVVARKDSALWMFVMRLFVVGRLKLKPAEEETRGKGE